MNDWLSDARFHLATALRSVGVGLATAMWLSVLTAHLELPTDTRTTIGIGGSLIATAIAQLLSRQPHEA